MLAKASANKVLKTDTVWADTMVIAANVRYPADSGLLARGVVRLVALVATLHRLGWRRTPRCGAGAGDAPPGP